MFDFASIDSKFITDNDSEVLRITNRVPTTKKLLDRTNYYSKLGTNTI